MPVAAANRIGTESVTPCMENNNQSSSLKFYGSSFITDGTGAIVADGSRDKEEVLTATFDLDELRDMRMSWGVFRDRRPECYK
jgi:N-carbamoylputrescine amidase